MSNWETVIGLEIHVQLLTKSKIFSSSSTSYGKDPNKQASYVDLGMPGTLPVLNKSVIRKAVKFGLAIDAKIARKSIFARKNYFYPDLPKNYQISQLDLPIVEGGYIEIKDSDNKNKKINITRAHLEEDAGKSIHSDENNCTYIDLNRAGTPLLEIVSEPEMQSANEAVSYMKKIHSIVTYLKISDGNMQEGSFRCDANVSIRKVGDKKLGTRTELKNINSFKFVEKAINYEVQRQIDLLEEGKKVTQETRLYDENKNITKSMRSKEEANDYRYFPDPDLLPIEINDDYILEIQKTLPELPEVKAQNYKSNYDFTDEQINIILSNSEITNFIDKILPISKISAKKLINYFISTVYIKLNKENLNLLEDDLKPKDFYMLIELIENKTIAKNNLKVIIDELWGNNKDISFIIEKHINENANDDAELINKLIKSIVEKNDKQVKEYKNGKTKIIGFFVGQVLKEAKGADPSDIKEKLIKLLDSI
tara:strand:- start:3359 stop:4801 length:1443 start_codon:yes stop_codon:yes gene_type:complete